MIPFLQVRPQSIRLKVKPQFPALVTATSPLTLNKSNGNFIFGLDIAALRASLDPIYAAALAAFPGILTAGGLVNFNAGNTDTVFPIAMPAGCSRFSMSTVVIEGASASLTTATIGLFTAPAGGGIAIVAGGSAVTVSSAAENTVNNYQALAVALGATQSLNISNFYVRIGTPQGSPATAKVAISYRPLPT